MAMRLVRAPELGESEGFETTERRYAVVLNAQLMSDDLTESVPIRVCNISAGGLMAIVPPHMALKGHVEIAIRHVGKLEGKIVWAKGDRIGLKFDEDIDPIVLLARRAAAAAAPSLQANRFVEMSKRTMAVPGVDFPIEAPFIGVRRA